MAWAPAGAAPMTGGVIPKGTPLASVRGGAGGLGATDAGGSVVVVVVVDVDVVVVDFEAVAPPGAGNASSAPTVVTTTATSIGNRPRRWGWIDPTERMQPRYARRPRAPESGPRSQGPGVRRVGSWRSGGAGAGFGGCRCGLRR